MKTISQPYIIAEIGLNYEGNMKTAKKLIKDASESGAHAVKFQIFQPETILGPSLFKENKKEKMNIKKKAKKLFLNDKKIIELRNFSKKNKIDFGCSVFDKESLLRVQKVKLDFLKIASSDINDIFLLNLVKKTKLPTIISTGMADINEIKIAVNNLNKPMILHCVSRYPCEVNEANLKRIHNLKKKFKVKIGYSDHTVGIDACKIAITMGAEVIEKHFTYNKLKKGDHALSANKNDLIDLVNFSKSFKKYLGNGQIMPQKKELNNRKRFRKGIYFSRNIFKGEKIGPNDIRILRPQNQTRIDKYSLILGKTLKKSFKKYQSVNLKYIK